MEFIRQRRKTDCGVASLAMLCEVTYEEAMNAIPWRRKSGSHLGTTTAQLREGADKLGYLTKSTPQHRLKPVQVPARYAGKPVGPEVWRFVPGRSLVKVPNTARSGWHWVVWTGELVFDPARGMYGPKQYHRELDWQAVPSSYMQFLKEQQYA